MLSFLTYLTEENTSLRAETEHFNELKRHISRAVREHGAPVHIDINGVTHKNVAGVKKIKGTPKADFALVDKEGNHVAFISHKAGSTPRDFQQFGGTSHLPDDHPDVQKLAGHIKSKRYKTGTHAMRLSSNNKRHQTLINQAVWGKDHSETGQSSEDNVDHLIQGRTSLEKHPKKKGVYTLKATGAIHNRGDKLPYKFVMLARPGKGRRIGSVKGFRGQIATDQSRKIDSFVQ